MILNFGKCKTLDSKRHSFFINSTKLNEDLGFNLLVVIVTLP